MVEATVVEELGTPKSRLGIFKGMIWNRAKRTRSLILDKSGAFSPQGHDHDRLMRRSHASGLPHERIFFMENFKTRLVNDGTAGDRDTDMDLMKERFAKLLLGEDMSGGGKGVSSALALSNAITNLAASAFGEQKRLEPMPAETKCRWKKEMQWLLSVTDYIVELVPSTQKSKDGNSMEIMVTQQRNDLQMSIPALKKLDAILLDCLDKFKDQSEFYYESKEENTRVDDKWWIQTPKVPPNGLSDSSRQLLQHQKDSVSQVMKAAMAINSQVLGEMEIPESYIEALPKNGRASLGDSIYKIITDDFFDPDHLLSSMDLSSEYKIVELMNKIEACMVIWRRKLTAKDTKSWGSTVSLEKREILEERAVTMLLILKHRFPGISQSDLDITKIQYNKDIGHAILEGYSRIIESLAFNMLSKIRDVMEADNVARNRCCDEMSKKNETPNSKTLLEFMGWTMDQADSVVESKYLQETKEVPQNMVINKRLTYLERLEQFGGIRSPTARH